MDTQAPRRPAEFQVVIIVNCEDNRLSPLTDNCPKCLLPIANRCLLSYQLEALEKCGAKEVYIVAQEEYQAQLSSKIATLFYESIAIELIVAPTMSGSADGLRAVKDRIRGDFICVTSDLLFQFSFGQVVNFHRRNAADITCVLAGVPIDEPEKKGGQRKVRVDEEDQEYIGTCEDGRLVLKLAAMEIEYGERKLEVSKPLLQRCTTLNVRNDVLDMEIYVVSHWILDLLAENKSIVCLKTELLPFLINRQFQPESFLRESIPCIQNRHRTLDSVEKWFSNGGSTVHSSVTSGRSLRGQSFSRPLEMADYVADSILSGSGPGGSVDRGARDRDTTMSSAVSELPAENEDMIRCYSLIYEANGSLPAVLQGSGHPSSASNSTITPFFCRITRPQTYLTVNREVPVFISSVAAAANTCLWTPVRGYMTKEQSVVGDGTTLGEKVTIKQCTIGQQCTIGLRSKLNQCVVMDGANVGDGCTIQNSVICFGAVIENNCNLNKCYIGPGAKVTAGSKLDSESL